MVLTALLQEWFSLASFIIHGSVSVGVNITRNEKTEKEKNHGVKIEISFLFLTPRFPSERRHK